MEPIGPACVGPKKEPGKIPGMPADGGCAVPWFPACRTSVDLASEREEAPLTPQILVSAPRRRCSACAGPNRRAYAFGCAEDAKSCCGDWLLALDDLLRKTGERLLDR